MILRWPSGRPAVRGDIAEKEQEEKAPGEEEEERPHLLLLTEKLTWKANT